MSEQVILVNIMDREQGAMDKTEAHRLGKLHRALSVFVFNSAGELLLQRRAMEKYHSGGLWANTCCSHPRPGEAIEDAAVRRLEEEMGLRAPLTKLFSFVYKADLGNSMHEHEFDHVFIARTDTSPVPNPEEVMEWKWASPESISAGIDANPNEYTIWFQLIFKEVAKLAKQ